MNSLTLKRVIKDKDDVLSVVGEALSVLGREDGVFSFGVVDDQESGGQLIYFDLPRLSPLQFNVSIPPDTSREQTVELIHRSISARLKIS